MGRLSFSLRLWWAERREALRWRIAYLLPRNVALIAFVRVCAATGDCPNHITYDSAYDAWVKGQGV